MKVHALILALGGLVAAAGVAQAQTAPPQKGALEDLQDVFGKVVGDAFHAPDAVVDPAAAQSAASTLGVAYRTSQEVPGAVFAGLLKPFADADAAAAPAPAAPPPRKHRHHARVHHRAPTQG